MAEHIEVVDIKEDKQDEAPDIAEELLPEFNDVAEKVLQDKEALTGLKEDRKK